jgi:hypothetical protein
MNENSLEQKKRIVHATFWPAKVKSRTNVERVSCDLPVRLLLAAMSFQGLISGAECATPSNPLSQVLKHTEGDRSLQQVPVISCP